MKYSLPDPADIHCIHQLLHELCEMGNDPYVWRSRFFSVMLPMLDAQFGAAYVMKFPVDPSDIWPRTPLAMHYAVTEHWKAWVERGDLTSHPVNEGVMARMGSDFTATRQELVDDEKWEASEFRVNVSNVAGWDQLMVSQTMLSPPGYVNGLDCSRAVGKPPFTKREVNLMHHVHGELARLWRRPDPIDINTLPPRQRAVLHCIRAGKSRKTIAGELIVSEHTIHSYEKALFQRAGVNSRGELLASLSSVIRPNLLP